MRESLAILILLACACSSFAESALPPALSQKAAATVFILDQPDSYCTVSPITRDGYMITALHCVRDCLLAAGAAEAGSIPFANFDLFVSVKPAGVVCKDVAIPALGVKSVTVVETGSALSLFDSHFMTTYTDAMAELRSHGFITRANDYAILKVALPHPVACWPLASAPAVASSSIWAFGYPLPDDISKQKPVLTATPGRVYASATESRAYAAAATSEEQTFLTTLYSDTSVLYSNAATAAGQSGGPVIDASGLLVGVVSGYTSVPNGPTRNAGETHELVAVGASGLLKNLSPAMQATLSRAQCH